MDRKRDLQEKKERVDKALERYFQKDSDFPSTLYKAIRHPLFSGEKRVRPIYFGSRSAQRRDRVQYFKGILIDEKIIRSHRDSF